MKMPDKEFEQLIEQVWRSGFRTGKEEGDRSASSFFHGRPNWFPQHSKPMWELVVKEARKSGLQNIETWFDIP